MNNLAHCFPRTTIGGVSVSRLIIGANWFKGFSHTSAAKDRMIRDFQNAKNIAQTISAFFSNGVDTLLIGSPDEQVINSIHEAQQKTGIQGVIIATPHFNILPGGDPNHDPEKVFDRCATFGATFCFPHQAVTDRLIDPLHHSIRQYDIYAQLIRERGMIPGLSTHMPETIQIADDNDLDVAAYIQIYNAVGFLMHREVDNIYNIIQNAKKPVITIKPMAAGHISPFVGLSFVWNTIRGGDMVAVGTLNTEEALELITLSEQIITKINQIS